MPLVHAGAEPVQPKGEGVGGQAPGNADGIGLQRSADFIRFPGADVPVQGKPPHGKPPEQRVGRVGKDNQRVFREADFADPDGWKGGTAAFFRPADGEHVPVGSGGVVAVREDAGMVKFGMADIPSPVQQVHVVDAQDQFLKRNQRVGFFLPSRLKQIEPASVPVQGVVGREPAVRVGNGKGFRFQVEEGEALDHVRPDFPEVEVSVYIFGGKTVYKAGEDRGAHHDLENDEQRHSQAQDAQQHIPYYLPGFQKT